MHSEIKCLYAKEQQTVNQEIQKHADHTEKRPQLIAKA